MEEEKSGIWRSLLITEYSIFSFYKKEGIVFNQSLIIKTYNYIWVKNS